MADFAAYNKAQTERDEMVAFKTVRLLIMAEYNYNDEQKFELCYGRPIGDFHPDYVKEKLPLLERGGMLSFMTRLDGRNLIRMVAELNAHWGFEAHSRCVEELAYYRREVI